MPLCAQVLYIVKVLWELVLSAVPLSDYRHGIFLSLFNSLESGFDPSISWQAKNWIRINKQPILVMNFHLFKFGGNLFSCKYISGDFIATIFAHLLCHVQKFAVSTLLEYGWEQYEFSLELNCDGMIVREMGPGVESYLQVHLKVKYSKPQPHLPGDN